MQTNKRLQSHKMSHQELKNLQLDQMSDVNETVTANKDSKFEIPVNEQHLVHVEIETPNYNQLTGQKTSVPFVQSFYPIEFARMEKDGAFAGKDVKVIHEPTAEKKVIVPAEDKSNLGEGADIIKNGEEVKKAIKESGAGSNVVQLPKQEDNKGAEGDVNKPSMTWTKPELQAEYKKLWDEEPVASMNKEQLLEAIEEKSKPVSGAEGEGEGNGEGE